MKMSYLKLHPLTFLFLFISLFTGYFRYLIYFLSIIFFHELGHVTMGILLDWEVDKILLCPFGGITYFHNGYNKKIKEELLILMAGPIYQILFCFLISYLNLATPLFYQIHISLLIFNFLPIYPLDGSKLILLFLEKITSFYQSYKIVKIISFFTTFTLLLKPSFLTFLLFFFFLKNTIQLNPKEELYFFIEDRIIHDYTFLKEKKITTIYEMKRDTLHILKGVKEKNYFKKIKNRL